MPAAQSPTTPESNSIAMFIVARFKDQKYCGGAYPTVSTGQSSQLTWACFFRIPRGILWAFTSLGVHPMPRIIGLGNILMLYHFFQSRFVFPLNE